MEKITKTNLTKYLPWLISVFFFFCFISMGCSTYMMVRQIVKPNPEITIKNIFLAIMLNGSGILVMGIVHYSITKEPESTNRTNLLLRFRDMMFPEDG